MVKKAFILSTCDTCKRILNQLQLDDSWTIQDIKQENIQEQDLITIAEQQGGFEACFNKRARKYKSEGYAEKNLSEADFKDLILGEYTFLKRPVFMLGNQSWAGNSKKTIEDLASHLNG